MPANGKYNGKNLSLTIDAVEFNLEGTSVVLDNEEADEDGVTFAELAEGAARQWFFQITSLTDLHAAGIWRMLWDNSGTDVAFVFKPYGNAAASADQPHFTGTCTILAKPPVGGDASASPWTYEARLDVVGEPTMAVA